LEEPKTVILSLENGVPFEADLGRLYSIKNDGISSVMLTWNYNNSLAGGALDTGGLTIKGINAIKIINETGMALDLSDDASIADFVKKVAERYEKIDILVNNAVDRRNMTSLNNATREKLRDSAEVNLNGQILLSQAVIPYMIAQGGGSIINISSMRGLDCPHFPFYPDAMGDQPVNYTTEKWAMVGLTKYMAGRYGKHNVRVNCIAPGGYHPGLADNPMKQAFVDTYIANTPLHRWANEDDIKGPITFLASDAAAYVTGATLVMDGGWTIW
jgi:NAD(P)-dependent dehydrogenase (short-subunit alcohol dehydrogenase family)